MKKIYVALLVLVSMAFMASCAPVESSFSMSATYVYTLRAEFGNKTAEIGLPTMAKAQFKVDSFMTDYVVAHDMGGIRHFGAAGSNPVEMQNMLFGLIKKSFDSLVQKVETLNMNEIITPCQDYYGGPARLVYEVTLYGQGIPVMRDTIVEAQRFNFAPAKLSQWITAVDGEQYSQYTFGENNVVVLTHSGGDVSTTYTVDPATGVMTVAAVNAMVEHTLTFKMTEGEPCLLSSINDQFYLLKQ